MKRIRNAAALCLLAMLGWAVSAGPAAAALRLCNRTSYIIYASTGVETGEAIVTHGWIRIVPGACQIAIAGALTEPATKTANAKEPDAASPRYFVYARTSQAHAGPALSWGGGQSLCAKETDFSYTAPVATPHCGSDDGFALPFAALDTAGHADWTATFTQSPPLSSAKSARQAGIVRLLTDIGYKFGTRGDLASALEHFRARMNLAEDASLDQFFDALETEAMKVASPAGYSICNDTDNPIWAALGMESTPKWIARGWWKVMPGACARAIASALSTDEIYLRVETGKGRALVAGKTNFCVTKVEFDIEGRTNCSARGLKQAGFAATNTRNRKGFTAHIGADGLLPPLHLKPQSPRYSSRPK